MTTLPVKMSVSKPVLQDLCINTNVYALYVDKRASYMYSHAGNITWPARSQDGTLFDRTRTGTRSTRGS